MFINRILHIPMRYTSNYGFVPHTLSPDRDPLDALVIEHLLFISSSEPSSAVRARRAIMRRRWWWPSD